MHKLNNHVIKSLENKLNGENNCDVFPDTTSSISQTGLSLRLRYSRNAYMDWIKIKKQIKIFKYLTGIMNMSNKENDGDNITIVIELFTLENKIARLYLLRQSIYLFIDFAQNLTIK